MTRPHSQAVPPGKTAAGTGLVLGLLGLAVGLAVFAVWFQWGQTRRCLAFFGPAAASRIQTAPRVELWSLRAEDGVVRGTAGRDISRASGLVHLRRGLVEDLNYRWEPSAGLSPARRLDPGVWDEAIVFRGQGSGGGVTIVALDLDEGGWLAVVGQPGRLPLGRIGPGLRKWVEATKQAISPEKSGF
jgi:hypothetical protein